MITDKTTGNEFLYVSYLFPPLIGGGVVRASQICKILPKSGWYPSMLTCQANNSTQIDEEYAKIGIEIIRGDSLIKEDKVRAKPTGISNKRSAFSTRILRKLARWIFLPDRQILWKRDAAKKALAAAKKHNWHCVFGTLHPVSSAWTGYCIAKRLRIPFILEFRDIVGEKFESSSPTVLHRWFLQSIVGRMAHYATRIIVVSNAIKYAVAEQYKVSVDKIEVITNGYLSTNKRLFDSFPKEKTNRFTMTYAGNFYRKRNPIVLLKAIKKLVDTNKIQKDKIRIIFIGNLTPETILRFGLEDVAGVIPTIPRDQVFRWYSKSDVLLLICDKSYYQNVTIPGKVFEYLMTEKPILGLLNKSFETATILEQSGIGVVADADDVDEIAAQIERLYQLWAVDKLVMQPQRDFINQFNFQRLIPKVVGVLEKVARINNNIQKG